MDETRRVALYARVSSERQADELTIQRSSKLRDGVIQVSLVLRRVRLWHVIGQIKQGLFVMLGDYRERRADISIQPIASTIE